MNAQDKTDRDRDLLLDTFAAEVTEATYPIALKYRRSGASLDLELEIWKTITELVRRRGGELLRPAAATRVTGAHCS